MTCESGEPQLRGNDQRILCRERDPNLGAPRDRVHRLVFAELHDTMAAAILREKRLKKWRRAWKLELIERHNPQWRDLYDELAM